MSSVLSDIANLPFDPLEEDDDDEPLTKPKAQPKPKAKPETLQSDPKVKKERKPKTPAQMESFNKIAEIRRNNIATRKQEALIKSAELLLSTSKKAAVSLEVTDLEVKQKKKKPVVIES